MRILFTGASSFSGAWFARELARAGHQVTAAFRSDDAYGGVRAQRVNWVRKTADARFGCAFGNDAFLDLIGSAPTGFDVLCHHGAQVGNYRSPDFDPYEAAALNLHRLADVLRALKDRGCGRLVLTGSVFEQSEGVGSSPMRAFSPYGLSKGLTSAAAEFYADREGVTFEKFVIPNPFGPYEEPRFTSYLMRTWLKGETARVQTPRYVRDNVPITLLARAYAGFVSETPAPGAVRRINPSFYPESQGVFAERVRREAAARLGLPCVLEFGEQTEFAEPTMRINTDLLDPSAYDWSEAGAWDEFVEYYANADKDT